MKMKKTIKVILASVGVLVALLIAGYVVMRLWEHHMANKYLVAADQGDAIAQYEVGKCYEFGTGFRADADKAAKYYALSAEQGNADAQYRLGRLYLGVSYMSGGVAQDPEKAIKLLKAAADHGHVLAMIELGDCHRMGDGVVPNDNLAVEYYLKAAELATSDDRFKVLWALRMAAEAYENLYGPNAYVGGKKSMDAAMKLYRKMAEYGDEYAKDALARLQNGAK